MVNKIPSYVISAGGKFAILSSRCHPASSQIMASASQSALESCGVESDDIYLIDCPSDSLLPGMSREIGKSGSFAAVISLAVLAADSEQAESIRIGMATSDFGIPVIPALVPESCGDSALALAAQKAARSAIELVNFSSMLAEFSLAQGLAELDDDDEEAAAVAKPRAASARRSRAGATTNGRRTTRKSRK
ncbi:MAG: hypothetical protein HYX67_16395 [Candidatus Melainabacteria bacterium]|nr:hypothetical protein [Candidatus Melainabacteria bacterium]